MGLLVELARGNGKRSSQGQIGSEELRGSTLKRAELSIAECHEWFPFLKDKITLHCIELFVKCTCLSGPSSRLLSLISPDSISICFVHFFAHLPAPAWLPGFLW